VRFSVKRGNFQWLADLPTIVVERPLQFTLMPAAIEAFIVLEKAYTRPKHDNEPISVLGLLDHV
jgi:hypothetical protein